MKILGIGVDIVENKRLKKSIKNKSFISNFRKVNYMVCSGIMSYDGRGLAKV